MTFINYDIYLVNHYDINNKTIKCCGVHIKYMFTLRLKMLFYNMIIVP